MSAEDHKWAPIDPKYVESLVKAFEFESRLEEARQKLISDMVIPLFMMPPQIKTRVRLLPAHGKTLSGFVSRPRRSRRVS